MPGRLPKLKATVPRLAEPAVGDRVGFTYMGKILTGTLANRNGVWASVSLDGERQFPFDVEFTRLWKVREKQ